ncbi:MAG: hypothetical protein LBS92_01000 [Candidatus Methanoplasma sp.]|nr:hypothetical protein [Candidatus Methanoplasma sp.]
MTADYFIGMMATTQVVVDARNGYRIAGYREESSECLEMMGLSPDSLFG